MARFPPTKKLYPRAGENTMISSNFGHSRLAHSLRKKRLGTGGINLILIPPHPVPASSWNVQEGPRLTGNERSFLPPNPTKIN